MPSMKVIKRRIATVSTTEQIMKAMNLVAAAKLQRCKARMNAALTMLDNTKLVIDALKKHESTAENIFAKPREIRNTAYVVITGDRGLCGGYNISVSKKALSFIDARKNEKIIAVGLKGWEYFRRRGKNILRKYTGVSETAFYEDAETIGGFIASLYTSGEVDEVYVAYTRFESTLSHVPHMEKVLPIENVASEEYESVIMEYEPDANAFLTCVAPMYLNVFIYGAMVESVACEQAARMISMDAAVNNAAEIIDKLSVAYNRMRQNAITQEINEIVSGANTQK